MVRVKGIPDLVKSGKMNWAVFSAACCNYDKCTIFTWQTYSIEHSIDSDNDMIWVKMHLNAKHVALLEMR